MKKTYLIFVLQFLALSYVNAQTDHGHPESTAGASAWSSSKLAAFEGEIEALRERYHIPGLSVGIVKGKHLAWEKGFGYADVENRVAPDEYTVYHIASVTKTFGAILLMQQVEAGSVSLDDPIAQYGINLGARWGSDERIKVKYLLTHTAMGNSLNAFKPGYTFRYNGDWYNRLGLVLEKASGQTFGELMLDSIIRPLGLRHTAPSTDDSASFRLAGHDRDSFTARVAKPYDWQDNRLTPVEFSYGFGPAAGLMSSVSDLALYSVAIDEQRFLRPGTWEKVFSPFVTPKGKEVPYGLGWYVRDYRGLRVVWHTGWWTGYSALFVKVPERGLTFIVLANSQDLSRPFYRLVQPMPGFAFFNPFRSSLNKDLLASDFAQAFFRYFVDGQ